MLAPDHRYPLGGSAAGLKALADDLMPPLIKHKGLSSATDAGTVGGKPAPWTRLVLQKLVRFPPLSKETMVVLRRCLGVHQAWRTEQDQIGDGHYIPDTRSQDATEMEQALQQRILDARKHAHIAPTKFRRSSTKHLLASGHATPLDGAASALASVNFAHTTRAPHSDHAHALTDALRYPTAD